MHKKYKKQSKNEAHHHKDHKYKHDSSSITNDIFTNLIDFGKCRRKHKHKENDEKLERKHRHNHEKKLEENRGKERRKHEKITNGNSTSIPPLKIEQINERYKKRQPKKEKLRNVEKYLNTVNKIDFQKLDLRNNSVCSLKIPRQKRENLRKEKTIHVEKSRKDTLSLVSNMERKHIEKQGKEKEKSNIPQQVMYCQIDTKSPFKADDTVQPGEYYKDRQRKEANKRRHSTSANRHASPQGECTITGKRTHRKHSRQRVSSKSPINLGPYEKYFAFSKNTTNTPEMKTKENKKIKELYKHSRNMKRQKHESQDTTSKHRIPEVRETKDVVAEDMKSYFMKIQTLIDKKLDTLLHITKSKQQLKESHNHVHNGQSRKRLKNFENYVKQGSEDREHRRRSPIKSPNELQYISRNSLSESSIHVTKVASKNQFTESSRTRPSPKSKSIERKAKQASSEENVSNKSTPRRKSSSQDMHRQTRSPQNDFRVAGIEPAALLQQAGKLPRRRPNRHLECKTVSIIGIPSEIRNKSLMLNHTQTSASLKFVDSGEEMVEKKKKTKRFKLYYKYSVDDNACDESGNSGPSIISDSYRVISELSEENDEFCVLKPVRNDDHSNRQKFRCYLKQDVCNRAVLDDRSLKKARKRKQALDKFLKLNNIMEERLSSTSSEVQSVHRIPNKDEIRCDYFNSHDLHSSNSEHNLKDKKSHGSQSNVELFHYRNKRGKDRSREERSRNVQYLICQPDGTNVDTRHRHFLKYLSKSDVNISYTSVCKVQTKNKKSARIATNLDLPDKLSASPCKIDGCRNSGDSLVNKHVPSATNNNMKKYLEKLFEISLEYKKNFMDDQLGKPSLESKIFDLICLTESYKHFPESLNNLLQLQHNKGGSKRESIPNSKMQDRSTQTFLFYNTDLEASIDMERQHNRRSPCQMIDASVEVNSIVHENTATNITNNTRIASKQDVNVQKYANQFCHHITEDTCIEGNALQKNIVAKVSPQEIHGRPEEAAYALEHTKKNNDDSQRKTYQKNEEISCDLDYNCEPKYSNKKPPQRQVFQRTEGTSYDLEHESKYASNNHEPPQRRIYQKTEETSYVLENGSQPKHVNSYQEPLQREVYIKTEKIGDSYRKNAEIGNLVENADKRKAQKHSRKANEKKPAFFKYRKHGRITRFSKEPDEEFHNEKPVRCATPLSNETRAYKKHQSKPALIEATKEFHCIALNTSNNKIDTKCIALNTSLEKTNPLPIDVDMGVSEESEKTVDFIRSSKSETSLQELSLEKDESKLASLVCLHKYMNDGKYTMSSRSNTHSLDRFSGKLIDGHPYTSRLFLTKDYKTTEVPAYLRRKCYDDSIRKKMRRKPHIGKQFAPQIFEVRFVTVDNLDNKKKADEACSPINLNRPQKVPVFTQTPRHCLERALKRSLRKQLQDKSAANLIEETKKHNAINVEHDIGGNLLQYCKNQCYSTAETSKNNTESSNSCNCERPECEVCPKHTIANIIECINEYQRLNVSSTSENSDSTTNKATSGENDTSLKVERANQLNVTVVHHNDNAVNNFHITAQRSNRLRQDPVSCPVLNRIDSSFDFLYETDDSSKMNAEQPVAAKMKPTILGYAFKSENTVDKTVKKLSFPKLDLISNCSPSSEESGYSSNKSSHSRENFFKKPYIAALLEPSEEMTKKCQEYAHKVRINSLSDSKVEDVYEEIPLDVLLSHDIESYNSNCSLCKDISSNKIHDDENATIEISGSYRQLADDETSRKSTISEICLQSIPITPSLETIDFNNDEVEPSILQELFQQKLFLSCTNLNTYSISFVNSGMLKGAGDFKITTSSNTNNSEVEKTNTDSSQSVAKSTRDKKLMVKNFFDNLLAVYEKEISTSSMLYQDEDFFENELLKCIHNINSNKDITLKMKRRSLRQRLVVAFSKMFGKRKSQDAQTICQPEVSKQDNDEEMQRQVISVEHQQKLQALARSARSYFSMYVQAVKINQEINDDMKICGLLKLLEYIESGQFTFLRKRDELNFEDEIKSQVRQAFSNIYKIAEKEAMDIGRSLCEEDIKLIRAFVSKYRIGLLSATDIIARLIGRGSFKSEKQLKAAVTYLVRLPSGEVNLKDFEDFCTADKFLEM